MILRFDKYGNFVSWMHRLPKMKNITIDGDINVRVDDIRRVIKGERKTAGGYQWKEILAPNLIVKK